MDILGFCDELSAGCSAISLAYFRTDIPYDRKADLSPVTMADRQVETFMREQIATRFPHHGIVGEEMPDRPGDRYFWYVDPIDGTKSFISGMPLFCTLAALYDRRDEEFVCGLIDAPALGERWLSDGSATHFNKRPCRTSSCTALGEARIYTTSPDIFTSAELETYERISRQAAMRRFGGDAYIYGLLASGHCDAVVESSLKPFDFMALVPNVRGAGGVITDWDGRALNEGSDGRVIAAATPQLHEAILAEIR